MPENNVPTKIEYIDLLALQLAEEKCKRLEAEIRAIEERAKTLQIEMRLAQQGLQAAMERRQSLGASLSQKYGTGADDTISPDGEIIRKTLRPSAATPRAGPDRELV